MRWQIMIEGPIGAAAFNNEFGRPNMFGYFRAYEQSVGGRRYGYHKPIMIAGGIGNIRDGQVKKQPLTPGTQMVLLGGPGMLIGLGGGAASCMGAGTTTESLDFASVQRGNPEMQRRAQEVIDRCWALGDGNPVLLIHDVGAGGLSNAIPESGRQVAPRRAHRPAQYSGRGKPGMTPLELWCNESQERYVLVMRRSSWSRSTGLCDASGRPFAVVGRLPGTAICSSRTRSRHHRSTCRST